MAFVIFSPVRESMNFAPTLKYRSLPFLMHQVFTCDDKAMFSISFGFAFG
jgi:hypothetical protein